MKALCCHGRHEVRVETVADPRLLSPRDVIVRVTAAAIGGLDLHLYDGRLPGQRPGNIPGQEFIGEVVEIGAHVHRLRVGQRVVVPCVVACGACWFCRQQLWALCDNSNPEASRSESSYGFSAAGLFGTPAPLGGFAGGQAEYVRVPFADVGPLPVPAELADEALICLGASLPAGWMAAEACRIGPGDIVAVFGCGAVGQFAIRSALLQGARQVIALDPVPERLRLAERFGGAQAVNIVDLENVAEELKRRTGGRGPDAVIDAVGLQAHGHSTTAAVDRAKQKLHLETDRPNVLRLAIGSCRKGGRVAVAGYYGGMVDKLSIGAAFAKGLTLTFGHAQVHRYLPLLLRQIEQGEIDPAQIVTHRLPLSQAPEGYRLFHEKQDGCVKVVLAP